MIKIDHLQKSYDGFSLDCSLEVKPGYITGLIGRNGAGKSTTFKSLLGLIRIDGGNVTLFGKDATTLSPEDRKNIGVVLSNSSFNEFLTIKDIIPMLAAFYDDFDKAAFIAQLEAFRLPMNKKLKEFSTGMKAKLKVMVAVSHASKVLILDEPTAGLDVLARDEILDLLRDYMRQDEERAILISSHISSDLENLCDDLYMIEQGRIIFHEDTDVLLSKYALLKVTPEQYAQLDHSRILRTLKESYGYQCLTAEKPFFVENYPDITVEHGSIDNVFSMMIRGARK